MSIITTGVARDALDSKADGNLYGNIYAFHVVTTVLAGPTVNVQLLSLHYLLGRHVYIPGASVQFSHFIDACLSFVTMYAATQKRAPRFTLSFDGHNR